MGYKIFEILCVCKKSLFIFTLSRLAGYRILYWYISSGIDPNALQFKQDSLFLSYIDSPEEGGRKIRLPSTQLIVSF